MPLLVDRSHRNVPQRGSSGIRSLGGNNNLAVLKKGRLRESSLTVQPAQNLIFSIKRRAEEQKGILRNSVLKVKPTNIETLYCIFLINRPGIQVVLIP